MSVKQHDPMETLARAVDLLLRLKVQEIKGDRSQRDMILMLGEMGASAREIASLLNTSKTNVAPELSKARAKKKPQRARRGGR